MADPLELALITVRTAEARQAIADDMDAILDGLTALLDDGALLLDVVTTRTTVQVVRQIVLERFDQGLSRPQGEAQALQALVREAYDLLTNPETAIDLRDWIRAATPFVRSS